MMLARLAFMRRANQARVGPRDTRSMTPIRSFRMRAPGRPRCPSLPVGPDPARRPGVVWPLPGLAHRFQEAVVVHPGVLLLVAQHGDAARGQKGQLEDVPLLVAEVPLLRG